MKILRSFVLLGIAFTIFMTESYSIETGYQTEPGQGSLYLKPLEKEPLRGPIDHYVVAENGDFAILVDCLPEQLIVIYDHTGAFLYGYSINSPGSVILEWGNGLNVFDVRTQTIVNVDQNGIVKSSAHVPSSRENSAHTRQQESFVKEINGNWYYTPPIYHYKLTVKDATGATKVLYRTQFFHNPTVIEIIILGAIFVFLGSTLMIIFNKKCLPRQLIDYVIKKTKE